MLDYSKCGNNGEPSVVFIDVERSDAPRKTLLSNSFNEFYSALKESDDEVW